MSTPEEASALLTSTAFTVMLGRYTTLSTWALLIYDWVIHLDKEVDLYWKRPWNAAKVLYLCNRFLPIVFMGVHSIIFLNPYVTDKICLFWLKFEGFTGVIELVTAGLILGLRVLALWNNNKIIIVLVAFALLSEASILFSILISTYTNMESRAAIISDVPYNACIALNLPGYFFAFWLPPLGYEALVFLLAIVKGYKAIYPAFTNVGLRGSRLLEVMIRDSLWYFLIVFSCDLACSLVWLHAPSYLLQVVVGFGLVGPSLAGSYLLMNLRDAYYHPSGETMDGRSDYAHTSAGEPPGSKSYGGRRYGIEAELDTSWALDSIRDFGLSDAAVHSRTTATSGSMSTPPQVRTIQFHEGAGPTMRRCIDGPSSGHNNSEEYELRGVANTVRSHSSWHEDAP